MNIFKDKYVFLLVILLFLVSCANQAYLVTPKSINKTMQNSIILHVKDNKQISFEELVANLSRADVVLVGEYHDNFSHHIAQYKIIKELQKKIKNASLVLEMISSDKQKALDNAKNIDTKDVKSAIGWDDKWKFHNYKDIINLTLNSSWYLKGGNLSKQEINTILQGAYPLKGTYSTTQEVRQKIANYINSTHNIDKKYLNLYTQVQQYKDRRMADILVNANSFSVLIAGNLHVNKTIGVPLHVKDFKSSKKVVVLYLAQMKDKIQTNEADFIWRLKENNE